MTFAPVGIKCPDHAGVGGARRPAQRAMQPTRHARSTIAGLEAPATVGLIALNVLVYLVTVYQGGGGVSQPGGELFGKGALIGAQIYAQDEWYRLVTAMFLHASLLHIALNMIVLYWCGTVVERALGTWRFLLIYFVSGIAGSAGALLFSGPFAVTVGASGAIYGIFGALLILEYRATGTFAGPALGLIVINLGAVVRDPEHLVGRPRGRPRRRHARDVRPPALPVHAPAVARAGPRRPDHGREHRRGVRARRELRVAIDAAAAELAVVLAEDQVSVVERHSRLDRERAEVALRHPEEPDRRLSGQRELELVAVSGNLDHHARPNLVRSDHGVERDRRPVVLRPRGRLPVGPVHLARDRVQDLRDELVPPVAVRHHREPASRVAVCDQVAPEALVAPAVPEPRAAEEQAEPDGVEAAEPRSPDPRGG